MAITLETRTDLITALVGLFDAAPSSELLTVFVASMDNGATVDSMVNDWTATSEFQTLYPTFLTTEEFTAKFLGNLLGTNVDSDTMTLAEDFVNAQINSGLTQGEAALITIRALSSLEDGDDLYDSFALAQAQLTNKVDIATHYATTQDITNATFDQLRDVTADVTADAQSVTDKKVLVDAGVDSLTQSLTTGQDFLTGTTGSDLFLAYYFDNQNTAQSGDMVTGGLGEDTLAAKIGNSADFAINMITDSVDIAKFQAQAVADDSADNEIAGDRPGTNGQGDLNGSVAVDAQDMVGTSQFWSTNSRADLVIEDVRNDSHETTIVMQDTDSGDVDYAVYFDDQHITAPGATVETNLYLEILDLKAAADTDNVEVLTNNPYTGVQITVDGVEFNLSADEPVTTSYQDLVDGLNALLDAAGLTTVEASIGEDFSKFNSEDGLKYTGQTIVLTNSGPEELAGIGWTTDSVVPADTNVHTAINDVAPSVSTQLTQVDMIVDNVGRGSESGDFRVGNMSTGDSGSQGIQQFNLEVQRDSWITSLSTTNDDLEVVNVVNDGNYNGDLRIGDNGDDDGYTGLENVRVFDASAMVGSVTLETDIDADVISKYDDLVDTANDVSSDNIEFNYTTGSGNDTVALTISEEAISYEDLELTIETGAGNDEVIFEVADLDNSQLNANWATDQAALNNIIISTGTGDDTVRALGDGEVTITTGSGDDTVYSDNSGLANQAATWLFNAANTDVNDIQGQGAGTGFFVADDATLTVTFSDSATGIAAAATNGFEVEVDLSDVATNNVVNTADLNQAIKIAINNDATLSKLLIAEDGPNNSLIVTSLIDGVFALNDLVVTTDFNGASTTSADLTATELSNYQAFVSDSTAVAATAFAEMGQDAASNAFADVEYTGTSVLAQEATTVTVTVVSSGASAVAGGATITFDGVTATLADAIVTDAAAATAFVTAYNAASDTNFSVTQADGVLTFTANDGYTVPSDAVATVTGDELTSATAVVNLADMVGVDSDELGNNNTINVGTGSDVVVLSTNAASDETVVFTGTDQGVVEILNFADGVSNDVLDFSAYLTTKKYNVAVSTSTDSQVDVATALLAGAAATNNASAPLLDANEITTITFTAAGTDTFAGLTAANLLTAINNDTATYGTLNDAALNAGATVGVGAGANNLVADTRDHVVLVENAANLGEYKAFYLTSSDAAQTGTTDNDFATAELIGTVDFGESQTFDITNFAG